MINPTAIFKLKSSWNAFKTNHPKFPPFLKAVNNAGIKEGMIIEISVKTADGKTMNSNVKVTKKDEELFKELSGLFS